MPLSLLYHAQKSLSSNMILFIVTCAELSRDGSLIALGTRDSVVRVIRYRYRVIKMHFLYDGVK